MHNYSKLKGYSLLICISLFLITSCNSKEEDKKEKDDSVATVNEPSEATLFGGVYDTLYADRTAFTTLPNRSKIIFKNTFQAIDSLTLHGWVAKSGDTFDTLPAIKFLNGRKGSIAYSPGTYFGNIVLHKKQFQQIKDSLGKYYKAKYVLFAPSGSGSDIYYKVFITKDNPSKLAGINVLELIDTEADANPSPPKNY